MLERSRYLAASSASAYSMVSMVSNFGPLMPAGGACLSLTYLASERVVPGYGGGEHGSPPTHTHPHPPTPTRARVGVG